MQMSVKDALTRIFSGVKNCSIAVKASFFGNLIGSQEKICCHGRAIAGDTGGIFSVQGWNEQHMCWCLRVEIIKGHNIFISQNNIGRDLSLNDLTKNAIGI
jgi:hypothetical protein